MPDQHELSEKWDSKLQGDNFTLTKMAIWILFKKNKTVISVIEYVEKMEPLYAAGGNAKHCGHSGNELAVS